MCKNHINEYAHKAGVRNAPGGASRKYDIVPGFSGVSHTTIFLLG